MGAFGLIFIHRQKVGDDYVIRTITSPPVILDIFNGSIFPNTEVLSLRNICGEGVSLSHEEWDAMAKELEFFPSELVDFLLLENILFLIVHVIPQALEGESATLMWKRRAPGL